MNCLQHSRAYQTTSFVHKFTRETYDWSPIKQRSKFDQLVIDLAALGFNVNGLIDAFLEKTVHIGFRVYRRKIIKLANEEGGKFYEEKIMFANFV